MKKFISKPSGKTLFLCLASMACLCSQAHAAIIITIIEDGSDVVGSYTGTLDLTNAPLVDSFTVTADSSITPSEPADFFLNPGSSNNVDLYELNFASIIATPSFGTGLRTDADTSSGDFFALGLSEGFFVVPQGWTGGTEISGSMTFQNQTFSSMGLSTGNYSWNFGNATANETIHLQVVPEPSSALLFGIGAGIFLVLHRFRKSSSRKTRAAIHSL